MDLGHLVRSSKNLAKITINFLAKVFHLCVCVCVRIVLMLYGLILVTAQTSFLSCFLRSYIVCSKFLRFFFLSSLTFVFVHTIEVKSTNIFHIIAMRRYGAFIFILGYKANVDISSFIQFTAGVFCCCFLPRNIQFIRNPNSINLLFGR